MGASRSAARPAAEMPLARPALQRYTSAWARMDRAEAFSGMRSAMDSLQASERRVDAKVVRAVERAANELRRGEPVLLRDGVEGVALVRPAEGIAAGVMNGQDEWGEGLLLLTARRAEALGLANAGGLSGEDGVVALRLAGPAPERPADLADPTALRPTDPERAVTVAAAPAGLARAAIELAKLARLLPAAILHRPAAPRDAGTRSREQDLLALSTDDLLRYRFCVARSLEAVAQARVPLADAENARIVAFRPRDGGVEHLAVIVGEPDPSAPVLVRLHSECLTGDLLGSLRCDCGDQLRGAIAAIAARGSGVLIYLAQEGRGIGLVNKLRAYRLQDLGADTLDANLQLGFEADERVYLPAAEILRRLGFSRVRLLTNNPEKVEALRRCGIEVSDRVALAFPSNGHNDLYLATKAKRFGHLF